MAMTDENCSLFQYLALDDLCAIPESFRGGPRARSRQSANSTPHHHHPEQHFAVAFAYSFIL